ncbi:MAG: Crp/Fnr family transcriptional regulator [Rhodoferax sp.]
MSPKADAPHFDMARYLSVLPLFSDLDAHERERLAQGCVQKRLTKGDLVFRQGDPCDAFYMVVTGQIKLFITAPSGQEKVIELISPGSSFGEALMFLEKPFIVSAQALADSLLIRVSRQAVTQEIERDPRFCTRMLAGMARRLHGLVMDVEGYSLHSGMQRLIGFLLRGVTDKQRNTGAVVTVSLPVSKATLASRLSLTPEYFSRVLHELESEGLIQIDKRDVRILDIERLSNYGSH